VRQAVGRDRLLDLAGRGGNIDASQDDKGDGDQHDNRADDDENGLHEHPANCQ
jgi:hypothetical protein